MHAAQGKFQFQEPAKLLTILRVALRTSQLQSAMSAHTVTSINNLDYEKFNNICSFVGNSQSSSCSTYSNDGECAQCISGLFLNSRTCECLDIQIPGCL